MTYNVFGGMLNLTQSIHWDHDQVNRHFTQSFDLPGPAWHGTATVFLEIDERH